VLEAACHRLGAYLLLEWGKHLLVLLHHPLQPCGEWMRQQRQKRKQLHSSSMQ
jgi:hypothetical protein